MQFPWKVEIGTHEPPDVRGEVVNLSKVDHPFRALYMSDLHFREGKTQRLCDQLRQIVATTKPDLLLLGGDLVDKRSGLPQLDALVSFARRTCLVGASGGNHDRRVGVNLVQCAVELADGVWLDRQPLAFFAGAMRVIVSGAVARQAPPSDVLDSLHALSGLIRARRRVGTRHRLCRTSSRLSDDGVCPPRPPLSGAWFYRWNGLRFARPNSVMLVSRGLHDAVPVRVNCPREVILCHCGAFHRRVDFSPPSKYGAD